MHDFRSRAEGSPSAGSGGAIHPRGRRTRDVLSDSTQQRAAILPLDGQVDGDIEAGQRGTEFVRDILQEPPFRRHQRLDALGQEVELAGNRADLVATSRADASLQVAPAETIHHPPEATERMGGRRPGRPP